MGRNGSPNHSLLPIAASAAQAEAERSAPKGNYMSCMLRVDGTNLNIDKLLEIDLKPDSFYKKGEYRTKKSNHTSSGARYLVSNADFSNFEDQKKDAIRFLRDNANSIKEIMLSQYPEPEEKKEG